MKNKIIFWIAVISLISQHTLGAQIALVSGANSPGRIASPKEVQEWAFEAEKGNFIVLSIGEVFESEVDPGFVPWIRLIGPDGAQVANTWGQLVGQVNTPAPLSGTYTVRVGSNDSGNDAVGAYLLHLALIPGTFVVPEGDHGGALTNGANHLGKVHLGDVDIWSFNAGKGDAVRLSVGEVFESEIDPGFVPWIRLYGPDGSQLANNWGQLAGQVSEAAPLTGTYTVLIASNDSGNDATGSYLLHFVMVPGAFLVPANDEGGALSNGANHSGSIHLGDLDAWSFEARKGDSIRVSIGERFENEIDPGLVPWIRLFGPNGAQLGNNWGQLAAQLSETAQLTGIHTLLVASNDSGNDAGGNYLLHLALLPAPFTVTEGDEGGPLTNGAVHTGEIHLGDLDLWTFTANKGDIIVASVGEVFQSEVDPGFVPWLRLFAPDGAQLANDWGALTAQVGENAPLTGSYTIVLASNDSGNDATGSYSLQLALMPERYAVSAGDQGGHLPPGGRAEGELFVGDVDLWTFGAHAGAQLQLQLSKMSGPEFVPWMRLYDTEGALMQNTWHSSTAEVAITIPKSGLYALIIGSNDSGRDATGSYAVAISGAATEAKQLRYMRQDDSVVLTWPSELTGFVLQSNTRLRAEGWTDLQVTPIDNGFNTRLSLSIEESHRFFRLRPD